MDQGEQAAGQDGATELSPGLIERGAAVAEYDRTQLRQPLAAADAAKGTETWALTSLQQRQLPAHCRRQESETEIPIED